MRGADVSNNMHRDLLRKLMKGSQWPKLYASKIRTFDAKSQEEKEVWLPFLLPSEVLSCLVKHGDVGKLLGREGLDGKSLAHLQSCELELGVAAGSFMALGLWVDGVATGWDRSESLEVISIHLPGLTGELKNLRFHLNQDKRARALARAHARALARARARARARKRARALANNPNPDKRAHAHAHKK